MEMYSQVVGRLTRSPSGSWISVPLKIPYFDNQDLSVVFPEVLEPQILFVADKALSKFLTLTQVQRLLNTQEVYNNYKSKSELLHASQIDLIAEDEIWLHVLPTEICVDLDETAELYVIAFCECSWEEEHGLQLVFKQGSGLTRVSWIDGYYTDNNEPNGKSKNVRWKFR